MEVRIIAAGTNLALLDQLESRLTRRGYRMAKVGSVQDLLHQLIHYHPSLLILADDRRSLAWNAKEACRRVREVSEVLIIAIAHETSVVEMLRAGADDCMRWPGELEELVARIVALLRRTHQRSPKNSLAILAQHGFWINFDTHEVNVRGKRLPLTNKEFRLLTHLASNSGQVVSHNRLLAGISSTFEEAWSELLLRQYIYRLRRKIERDSSNPQVIVTHRGVGYSFDPRGLQ